MGIPALEGKGTRDRGVVPERGGLPPGLGNEGEPEQTVMVQEWRHAVAHRFHPGDMLGSGVQHIALIRYPPQKIRP